MDTKDTKTKKTEPKKKTSFIKYVIFFWFCFLIAIGSVIGILYAASNGWLGEIPNVRDLENPDINIASIIISSDNVVLDKFESEKRIPIKYKDLPKNLINALLAKEDVRFYEHSGVDGQAILRAVSGGKGGGSTITQQLAKQLYTGERSKVKVLAVKQKLLEWVTSISLEKIYTKEEIVTMYFNKFDFVKNAKGVETASRIYFNKSTKDLNLQECAMFVAMLENPVKNNPIDHPVQAKTRRDLVLNQMVKYNFLSTEEGRRAKETALITDYKPLSSIKEAYSAYFKYALKRDIEGWMKEEEKISGKKYDLYRDGLKIYVTLDSRMQGFAEDAIKKHLQGLQRQLFGEHRGRANAPFYDITLEKGERILHAAMRRTCRYKTLKEKGMPEDSIIMEFKKPIRLDIFTWNGDVDTLMSPMDSIRYHKHIIQAGIMSMEPKTGNIKAWVGGIDWGHFQFDHVQQARRQVGSTFKPFVYGTAINQMGYTPCNTVSNDRFKVGNWSPGNANGKYGGAMTLRQALAFSVNVVAARLISQTTPGPVIQLARDMGVTSPIKNDLTICLGSADLTLYEMVGAFSTWANAGNYIKPEMVWRIEDKNGKVIREYNPKINEVVSEDVAYTMLDLMKGVIQFGTAKRLRAYGIHGEVAGKTGTTNDNSDGWFMGITPNLVTGVWVGCEDRFAHFRSTAMGQGAVMAMPIWAYYMQDVYKTDKLGISQSDKFTKPEGIEERWDCGSMRGFSSYGDIVGGYGLQEVADPIEGGDGSNQTYHEPGVNDMLSSKKDSVDFNK